MFGPAKSRRLSEPIAVSLDELVLRDIIYLPRELQGLPLAFG
jgi:hypothetical protein